MYPRKELKGETKIIEHWGQVKVEECSPELQKEPSGGWDKTQVKFIRAVHSEHGDVAGFAIPKPKVLHGFYSIYVSFTLPKSMFAIQPFCPGNACKKRNHLFWVQHLPWTRCQYPRFQGEVLTGKFPL